MSLPPFLFSAASATAARSAFASTNATANATANAPGATTAEAGNPAGLDFRQAFMQMAQGKAAPANAIAPDKPEIDPLLAKLNLLLEGELLPQEVQESLKNLLADVTHGVMTANPSGIEALTELLHESELSDDQLGEALAALDVLVADTTEPPSPDVVTALRDLVDLLTDGKILPIARSADAMNLSDDPAETVTDAILPAAEQHPAHTASPTTLSFVASSATVVDSAKAAPVTLPLSEPGETVDLSEWLPGLEDEAVNDPRLKTEIVTNTNTVGKMTPTVDVLIKPDTAASVGAILSADFELPDTAASQPLVSAPGLSKAAGIAGLQSAADAQLNPAMRVQVAFGHAQWSEALAERTAWLASQQIHSADLHLDPPELGPLQVRISVHQDQAVVNFVSANPQVRDALDQSMARLRELLQEQGMQLVDAGVSDQRRDGNGDAESSDGADRLINSGLVDEPADNKLAPGETMDARYGVDDFV